jgi:hypothetical protein
MQITEAPEWRWYRWRFDIKLFDDNELQEHWRNVSLFQTFGIGRYYGTRGWNVEWM